jgi:hypothetical protein
MNDVRRWDAYPLKWDERPKNVYQYYVSGASKFPFDMLRMDNAWPATTNDAMEMTTPYVNTIRSILIRSYKEPTLERWASFGWSVGLEKL